MTKNTKEEIKTHFKPQENDPLLNLDKNLFNRFNKNFPEEIQPEQKLSQNMHENLFKEEEETLLKTKIPEKNNRNIQIQAKQVRRHSMQQPTTQLMIDPTPKRRKSIR